MNFIDLSKYRKELIDAANLICSFLSEEEKKALEIIKKDTVISFRDQIVITYYDKYPMFLEERERELKK